MRASWLMRFSWALLLLLGFSVSALAGGSYSSLTSSCSGSLTWVNNGTGTGYLATIQYMKCVNDTGGMVYGGFVGTCVSSAVLNTAGSACQCDTASGASYQSTPSPTGSCKCPDGKEMVDGKCMTPCSAGQIRDVSGACINPPTSCQHPKEDDGNGGCKCPEGTVASGETCIKPDCAQKQQTCSTGCGGLNGDMSAVAYFYCESTIESGSTSIVFSDDSYKCECAPTTPGCPAGQIGITATKDGAVTCGNPKNPGCPTGSYYGDFNGQTGCIKPDEHNDPDETPKNCIEGTGGVYFGSTLYCVPEPNSDTTCPTGTTSFLTDTGLKICKGTDTQGNPTGDSPDTNGYIKGTPTSGSGVNPDDGDNSGTGISAGEEQIADKQDKTNAELAAIKANTDAIKGSGTQTANNTQATANNTATIADALTGTASTVAQGSFAASTAAIQAEVETLKAQYGSTLTTVKNQMTGFLSTVAAPTGVGGLPCYDPVRVPVLNIDFSLCFTRFEEALRVIGNYIYGIAFLFAGLIILGSSRSES